MISYSVKSDPIQSLIQESKLGYYFAIHDNREFKSVFQPMYNKNIDIIGYESLIRISEGDKSINPQSFFDEIENDIEKDIFYFLLSAKLHFQNFSLFNKGAMIFINASPNVFNYLSNNDVAIERLFVRLYELNIEPENLIYEITEKYNGNLDETVFGKNVLFDKNIRIAVDDYGTGFFNIDVVKKIEPQIIKLDRSIIRSVSTDSGIREIEDVIALKEHFNFQVVAEGVETKEEFEALKKMDIDIFQGFYFSKPMPTIDFIS